MRAMTCAIAALMVAFTLSCKDRGRDESGSRIDNPSAALDTTTGDRVDNAAEETKDAVSEGARDVGNAAEDAAEDTKDAAKDATDKNSKSSYDRRDEFRQDVRERVAAMDKELAELGSEINKDASAARVKAVAAARDARRAAGRSVDRLATATAANWEQVKREVSASLDSAERQIRALRPDSKPMGGTGGPS